MGDKGETSVSSCGPRHPEWETSVGDKGETSVNSTQSGRQGGDKCKLMRPKAPRVGDKGGTSVKSCGPKNPEWETSVGDKCGRQVWETSVGDKCGRQVGDKCKFMRPNAPRVGDKGETSVNSCGPRHPEWETKGRQV